METAATSQVIKSEEPYAEVEPELEPESEVEPGFEEQQTADHSSLIGIVVAVVCLLLLAVFAGFAMVNHRKRKAYMVRYFNNGVGLVRSLFTCPT